MHQKQFMVSALSPRPQCCHSIVDFSAWYHFFTSKKKIKNLMIFDFHQIFFFQSTNLNRRSAECLMVYFSLLQITAAINNHKVLFDLLSCLLALLSHCCWLPLSHSQAFTINAPSFACLLMLLALFHTPSPFLSLSLF